MERKHAIQARLPSRAGAILAALILATLPGHAGTDLGASVDRIAEEALAQGRTPGMTIAVARGAEVVHAAGYGFSDVENQIPAAIDTNYRIGSITKPLTALAVLQLVEAEKLALTDPVTAHLPDYNTHGRSITIQQLLDHTAGIPSYTDLVQGEDRRSWRLPQSSQEMRTVFESRDLLFEPGSAWYYSNSGYYLLGLVIESVTGSSWEEALNQQIFIPAGLSRTQVAWSKPLIKNRASGYDRGEEGWVNAEPISMTVPYSAGALCSTAPDLLRWMDAVTDGGLISRRTLQRMTQPLPLKDEQGGHSYALGFFTGSLDGHAKIAHRGDINGFAGYLSHYPEDNLTIAVLTNYQGSRPDEIERRVARAALGLPWPSPENLAFTEDELKAWPGTYGLGVLTIKIAPQGDGLSLAVPGLLPQPLPLLKQPGGELWLAADPDLRIRLAPVGEASGPESQWVRLSSGDMWLMAPRERSSEPQEPSREE